MHTKTQIDIPLLVPSTATTWEGWGTSLCWFAHALGSDRQLLDLISQLLFSHEGLAFNIARYNIGGANEDDKEGYRAGAAVPCCLTSSGALQW
jgi:hypothetical protein